MRDLSRTFNMGRLMPLLTVLLGLLAAPAPAQDEGIEALEHIRRSLEQGDPSRLMAAAGPRIDLTIFGTSELLSRSQAFYVVKSFFSEYPPTKAELIDTSESDGNWFASSGYWYETGRAPLSVYIRLRQKADVWELRELRIDRSPPK